MFKECLWPHTVPRAGRDQPGVTVQAAPGLCADQGSLICPGEVRVGTVPQSPWRDLLFQGEVRSPGRSQQQRIPVCIRRVVLLTGRATGRPGEQLAGGLVLDEGSPATKGDPLETVQDKAGHQLRW